MENDILRGTTQGGELFKKVQEIGGSGMGVN